MAVQCSSRTARRLGLGAAAAALALLGGCVVAPVEPYQVGDPVAYPATVSGDVYYGGTGYYGYPYYGVPSLSFGVYQGWGGWRDGRRPPPPPRPGWGRPGGPQPGWGRPVGPRPGWGSPGAPRPPGAGVRPPAPRPGGPGPGFQGGPPRQP